MDKIEKTGNHRKEIAKRIIRTYQKVDAVLRNFLKPYGITLQQYNVLKILKGAKKPITNSLIRERMLEPMADTSRLVERLFAKGLVIRKTSNSDRRLTDVSLTAQGIEFIESINTIDRALEKVYLNIDSNDAKVLNRLLDKLRG